MSTTHLSTDKEAVYFLTAYKSFVVNGLYEELLADMKPRLRHAAEEAAKQLEPAIQAYADRFHDRLVVQLLVKGLEGESE